jgi:hypothetical protein
MVLLWNSQTFGKILETFGVRFFFLRFFKSMGWMDFPVDFRLF